MWQNQELHYTGTTLQTESQRLSVIINKNDYQYKLTLKKKKKKKKKGHLLFPNNIYLYINLSDCKLI